MQSIIFFLFFLTTIQAQQNSCSCSCCTGFSCTPIQLPNITVQTCTLQSCLERCRSQYSTCLAANTGGLVAQCFSTPTPTTTVTSWSDNLCSCSCCPTNSNCPSRNLGVISSSTCSSQSCTQSCLTQYAYLCSPSSLTGTCLSNAGAALFCECQCCENNSNNNCLKYRINTNENCQTCQSLCQQYSPCRSNPSINVRGCTKNMGRKLFSSILLNLFLLLISK